MRRSQDSPLIGRIVGTERQPNTAFHFYFWTSLDVKIGIGSLVVAEHDGADGRFQTTWGVVVEALGYNDLQAPLYDYIGADADPSHVSPTQRSEIRLFKAAALRREPDEPVGPPHICSVYQATEPDVVKALRIDKIPEERRIPIGVYQSGECQAPVYIDSDFLLGPEAGHVNVTGTSGLAAKTSLIEFLIASVFAHKQKKTVAVVCFNVKGSDLLFLDKPPHKVEAPTPEQIEADEQDAAIYIALNIPREPFKNVQYYAPFRPDGVNCATRRTHPDVAGDVRPLSWGLREVMRYTLVMLNREDIDTKADAFIEFVWQSVVEPGEFKFESEEQHAAQCPEVVAVTSFAELVTWFEFVLKINEKGAGHDRWRSHATATIRKIYNRLANLTTRYAGLLSENDQALDLPFGDFKDETIYVVDVAQLKSEAQYLVFARVIGELRDRMESRDLGVENVIVVVDELNQYVPSSGAQTHVATTIRDICARGRYQGLVLFGAQQFRSQVDRQVVGNCATALWGQIEMEELAQSGYSVFDAAIKEKLGALSPGQMLVKHPHFMQPVFIRFPRPAVLQGRAGTDCYPPSGDLPLEEAVWRQLQSLDRNLARNDIADAIAQVKTGSVQDDLKNVVAAMKWALLHRSSTPLRDFVGKLKRPAGIQSSEPTMSRVLAQPGDNEDDPFE